MALILTNTNLIDCVSPSPIPGASVIIEGQRITQVLLDQPPVINAGDRVVDLDGAYLLPGLWDVHIHPEYLHVRGGTVAEHTVRFGQDLMQGLTEAGVVGVRTGGAAHFMDVAWRNSFESGPLAGPRILACGYFLTTTGGHFIATGHARECDGPHGFVKAIREQIKNGVDHIKLNLSGGVMGPFWDRHWHSFMLEEELEAAFRIAHQRGYQVMAHATNPQAVKAALSLGAHSVEHGYIMDQDCIQMFLDEDAWYVPTLSITHLTPSQATTELEKRWVEQRNLAADLVQRAEDASPEHQEWFRCALDAGVKMAIGSDIRPLSQSVLLEMGLWIKDGATPWQTLVAATKNAAELCGLGSDLGTVEAGKLADLIVVRQNPLDDISHLGEILLVMKNGEVVAERRSRTENL